MKLSKLFHVISIIVGFVGVIAFLGAVMGGADNLVFGVSKLDALMCSGILILIAIWSQQGVMHHMKLEEKGEWL